MKFLQPSLPYETEHWMPFKQKHCTLEMFVFPPCIVLPTMYITHKAAQSLTVWLRIQMCYAISASSQLPQAEMRRRPTEVK